MREESEVVIVGAGPSGLSVGACLRARGVPFVMLEREAAVGPAWRRHYDRLHLHTVKQFSSLPRMPWPEGTPTYPSRAEFVAYLEAYAQRFGLVPRFGEDVRSARREGDGFLVRTAEKEYRARSLVVATGLNRVPYVPSWPGQGAFEGTLVHSSAYKNGAAFQGKRALVVGTGNSGAEIALDLWEHGARPTISVRGPVHVVPRDMNGIPSQVTSLFLFSKMPPALADKISLFVLDRVVGDLSRHGFVRPELGPISQVVFQRRIPLIDVGTVELVKQGHIEVAKEVQSFGAREVTFVDGARRPFDLVVLATGYRTGIADVLEGAEGWLDERGYPRHFGAPVPDAPGLYFIGFRNPLTGQIHDIAIEAERIAGFVAKEGRS
ncbi:flavin-containing monooxygenase [Polyangium aurulentum]|uniref:flavin-containing monooxygenase n=1 Tax=Polyangium aurulentum TaxID=2567896 RepID=UPI0010AEA8CC|nr:NAD(P)/FAD-dependent oxidoreductase [Polyangium aurulentum]UQA58709.1 NAD(P)/FAD-dependent oxidoreductase [Polyangium aurulentum]